MPVYLDTETTGLSPARGDTIVEIAIIDEAGRTLIDTLVDPERSIPWQASRVHGITQDMVHGKPSLAQLMPKILDIVCGEEVVIYNARFDMPFFPGRLTQAAAVQCAMVQFAQALGGGPWRKLDVAAKHVGHRWTGQAHRALADTLACRSVWRWLQSDRTASQKDLPRTTPSKAAHAPPEEPKPVIIICPGCAQRMRVPSGKRLEVTCPRCYMTFPAQT